MRNGLLAALMLALTASAVPTALADDELVANPAYKHWAAFKPGSMTKLVSIRETGEDKPKHSKAVVTLTLKEITAEKAVLEIVTEMTAEGKTKTMPAQTKEIKARVPKVEVGPQVPPGSTIAKTGEGDEEVALGGKKYKCHWEEYAIKGEMTGTMKVWNCPDVVGGAVRTTSKVDQPVRTASVTEVAEFKAAN